jgi:chorismate mutase
MLPHDIDRSWLKDHKPFVIAGPCSAESPEQVIDTTRELASEGRVHALRAGLWKPRTRPNTFEGVGETGLNWLIDAGEKSGLPVFTEVANAEHVKLALKHGIKGLWIGARTTVNPFYVQEIADSLKGQSDVIVLVKNPIHPDLHLWLGAIERLLGNGITKVGAVHRGFSSFKSSQYRNVPMWEQAIELKRILPELPIICDPSHIAGNRNKIREVSQKALDLNMDGLMIESHIDPDHALSDAEQQLTPRELNHLLDGLLVKVSDSDDHFLQGRLSELRSQIDKIDEDLLELLKHRLELVRQIGVHKKNNDLTIFQLDRWNEIIETRKNRGDEIGLEKEFVKVLFEQIHAESIRLQTRILKFSDEHEKSTSSDEGNS